MDSEPKADGLWRRTSTGPRWGLGILSWLFAWVPPRVAYILVLPAICHWYTHFNHPRESVRRAMVRLGCRWPLITAFAAFAQYGFILVDRFYFHRGRLQVRVETEGQERLQNIVSKPGAVVLLGGHCGALEMAIGALEDLGRPVHAVAVNDPGAGELFRGVGDPTEGLGFGRPTIVADGTVAAGLRMLKVLRAGEALGFKADRVLPGTPDEDCLKLDFAGAMARFPAGPLRMIGLGKARGVVVSAFRTGPGRFEILADALDTGDSDPAALGQALADRLADHVRRRPDQWFNFYPFWPEDEEEIARLPVTIPPWFRAAWPGMLVALAAGLAANVLASGDPMGLSVVEAASCGALLIAGIALSGWRVRAGAGGR